MQQNRLQLIEADLTTLRVDAIVNAADERMLGGGGVDGAIHSAAGPRLLAACRGVEEVRVDVRCPTGEARVTPGFDLKADYVIHTVGPIWRDGEGGEAQLLEACYRSVFASCRKLGIGAVAFPAISCGVYGYPVGLATEIAVWAIRGELAGNDLLERVLIASVNAEVTQAVRAAIEELS